MVQTPINVRFCHVFFRGTCLCYHRNFTWCYPWRYSRGFLGCFRPQICCLVFLLSCGVPICYWCYHLVWLYWHLLTFLPPSIMYVGWLFPTAFGVLLNNYAILINAVWCVSFIVADGQFGFGFCNTSTKSRAASVAASVDKIIGIIIFCGGNSTMSAILSDLVSVKIICNTYSVQTMGQYTIPVLHVCSM